MIGRPDSAHKRVAAVVLGGLLGLGVLAAAQTPPPPDCGDLVRTAREAIYDQIENGTSDWRTAEALMAQAYRCLGDARTADHALLLGMETYVLAEQRRFAEAIPVFERFFTSFADVAAPEVVATMHRRLGYIYNRLGWTSEMLAEFTRGAAMADQLPPSIAAQTLLDAGEIYRTVNDFVTANRYFTQAESLIAIPYAEDPATYGRTMGTVRMWQARLFLNEADAGLWSTEQAIDTITVMLDEALRLLPPTPFNAIFRTHALITRAQIYWWMDDPAAALEPLAEAHRLSAWFREGAPQLEVQCWRWLADTYYRLGRYDEARRANERAVALATAAEDQTQLMWALLGLGEVAEAEAEVAGSPDGYRRAEVYYRRAIALAEEERHSYGTQDWSASKWEVVQAPYRYLMRLLIRQGRYEETFLALDATRARYLRDLRTSAGRQARLGLEEATHLDSLKTALAEVRTRLGDPDLTLAEQTTLEARELTLQREVDVLIGYEPAEPPPLTLEDVQRALRPRGQVLLTYFLDDDVQTAFVVRPDTFVAVPLSVSPDSLQAQLTRLGGLWGETNAPDVRLPLTPLHTLYEAVYAPIARYVPAAAPLVVIPDGPLVQVPFGMLLAEDHPPFAYADAPYLLRQHPITVELAASLLLEPAPPSDLPLDLLALGRSRFDSLASERPAGRGAARLPDLPNVGEELRHLGRRVGDARLALDEEATEAFFDANRDDARVIHLASHALVDPEHPLYSHVVLWDSPGADDDGLLHLHELQGRPLRADLVTLSGCSTARGRHRVGEGMIGLQYAFRAAGVQATVATLWQVEDAAIVDLMDRFYLYLGRGLPKDEALRQAQLDYLGAQEGTAASPFFWAAPVLYGSPAPLPLAPGSPSAALWIPVGLLLVLAGIVLPRLRRRRPHG